MISQLGVPHSALAITRETNTNITIGSEPFTRTAINPMDQSPLLDGSSSKPAWPIYVLSRSSGTEDRASWLDKKTSEGKASIPYEDNRVYCDDDIGCNL